MQSKSLLNNIKLYKKVKDAIHLKKDITIKAVSNCNMEATVHSDSFKLIALE